VEPFATLAQSYESVVRHIEPKKKSSKKSRSSLSYYDSGTFKATAVATKPKPPAAIEKSSSSPIMLQEEPKDPVENISTPEMNEQKINSYSINLMWINKTLDPNQKYLSAAKDDDELKEKLLNPVIKWANANPTAEVSLWYDSAHVTPKAVKDTQNALGGLLEERGIMNVKLRDIRSIPIVKENQDAFSDQIPLYFRVDMFKPIILVHSVESEKKDSAIFADLEVGDKRPNGDRMGKDELFKPSVLRKLNSSGLIINKAGGNKAEGHINENQFLQLVNNPRMISAIKHAIVNVNLVRAENALNHDQKETFVPALSDAIFGSTLHDVFHYYNLTGNGKTIKVRSDVTSLGGETNQWVDFNPEEHGYAPLGNLKSPFHGPLTLGKNGEIFTRKQVLKEFNVDDEIEGVSRNVHVRTGRSHPEDLGEILARDPADGGDTYRVQLWK
jgi:hypothetical protein